MGVYSHNKYSSTLWLKEQLDTRTTSHTVQLYRDTSYSRQQSKLRRLPGVIVPLRCIQELNTKSAIPPDDLFFICEGLPRRYRSACPPFRILTLRFVLKFYSLSGIRANFNVKVQMGKSKDALIYSVGVEQRTLRFKEQRVQVVIKALLFVGTG